MMATFEPIDLPDDLRALLRTLRLETDPETPGALANIAEEVHRRATEALARGPTLKWAYTDDGAYALCGLCGHRWDVRGDPESGVGKASGTWARKHLRNHHGLSWEAAFHAQAEAWLGLSRAHQAARVATALGRIAGGAARRRRREAGEVEKLIGWYGEAWDLTHPGDRSAAWRLAWYLDSAPSAAEALAADPGVASGEAGTLQDAVRRSLRALASAQAAKDADAWGEAAANLLAVAGEVPAEGEAYGLPNPVYGGASATPADLLVAAGRLAERARAAWE